MSKGLELLSKKRTSIPAHECYCTTKETIKQIKKELKALELIKEHFLSRDADASGVYLELHNGYYEPYYTIEIREGARQIVSKEEYDLLKDVLLCD